MPFILPMPEQDDAGFPRLTYGRALSPDELDAYLYAPADLGRLASWCLGIILPIVLALWGSWRGFVLRDIYIPGASAHAVGRGWWATGTAAAWGGVSALCIAVMFHVAFFWARKKRHRAAAVIAFLILLAVFFFVTFMASTA